MSTQRQWIELANGSKVLLDLLAGSRTEQDRFQRALRDNYGQPAFCLCARQPLAIKYKNGAYHLARYPKTGTLHRQWCSFYGDTYVGDDFAHRYAGGIRESEGIASVSLGIPLRSRTETSTHVDLPPQPKYVSRGRVTLLGFLRFLFEHARLNRWTPAFASRSLSTVYGAIYAAGTRMVVGRSPLRDLLVTPARPDVDGTQYRRAISAKLGTARKEQRRMLLFGDVIADRQASVMARLQEVCRRCGLNAEASDDTLARVSRSYGRVLGYNNVPLFLLAVAEPTARDCLHLIDVALLATNAQYIPVDSLYELRIADMLVQQHRTFVKPLRAPEADHLPDFVLFDTLRPTEMEVFGRHDPDYLAAAARKQRGQIWWWDATTQRTPPPFPQRTRR